MSEIIETTQETTQQTPVSTSVLNLAVEAVVSMINAMDNFAGMKRGALGSGNSLCCQIAPSLVESVFMDKNSYIPITLAINGKHTDLQVLSDTLNNIMDTLTRKTEYTEGNGFEIVDITSGNLPRVIGRENNNAWVMACDLVVKLYRKDEETA